ncbi:MAG: transposase [Eubacteriaceae bacterium]|nr:transposase [Eubacteriaceae bacterium]
MSFYRKSNRLDSYDYSKNGAYFITICTKDKQPILWTKINNTDKNVEANNDRQQDNIALSEIGNICEDGINKISNHYLNTIVDAYVIMPNHIHLIILLQRDEEKEIHKNPAISQIIQQLKGYITRQAGCEIWQKSFYDRIIRGEKEYKEIAEYIENNPLKWQLDRFYI